MSGARLAVKPPAVVSNLHGIWAAIAVLGLLQSAFTEHFLEMFEQVPLSGGPGTPSPPAQVPVSLSGLKVSSSRFLASEPAAASWMFPSRLRSTACVPPLGKSVW